MESGSVGGTGGGEDADEEEDCAEEGVLSAVWGCGSTGEGEGCW